MFYETEKEGLTTDHLAYHGNALERSYKLWKEEKKGFLSTFPFGAFAFARLDERLKDSELWNSAPRKPGRDPMGLTPSQPNIEFFTTECYGGPKQFDQFPIDNKHAFSMIAELFGPRSRGTVSLRSADPTAVPVVDCGYLTDPLDVEVLAEACRFGNEIIMEGAGTKDIVKGAWPPEAVHHKYMTREDWKPYVREQATTCKLNSHDSLYSYSYKLGSIGLTQLIQATTHLALVPWARPITPHLLWTRSCASRVCVASALLIAALYPFFTEATPRCQHTALGRRRQT